VLPDENLRGVKSVTLLVLNSFERVHLQSLFLIIYFFNLRLLLRGAIFYNWLSPYYYVSRLYGLSNSCLLYFLFLIRVGYSFCRVSPNTGRLLEHFRGRGYILF